MGFDGMVMAGMVRIYRVPVMIGMVGINGVLLIEMVVILGVAIRGI